MARLNSTTNARIDLPHPHPGQQAVLNSQARFVFLSAGRRWFKTTTFAIRAIMGSVRDGRDLFWGAPTADQVSIGWDFCERALRDYRFYEPRKSEQTLQFYNPSNPSHKHGKIMFRSLDDPDNARGFTADDVLIDEAGDVGEKAWYEVLRPMLMTTRGGALIGGTPKGRNWYYREHIRAMGCKDGSMESFVAPTVGCEISNGTLVRVPHPLENPLIPFEEILDAFQTMPEYSFRQEILAEFMDDAGGAFTNIENCCCIQPGSRVYNPEHTYSIGVDWGKTNDYTAMSVVDLTAQEEVYLDRSNQVDYSVQAIRLMLLSKLWKPTYIIAEKNSIGDPIIESLTAMGLNVDAWDNHNRAKKQLMDRLSLGFQTNTLKVLDDPVRKDELKSYVMKVLPQSGLVQYNAPNGMHDDTVIALALACKPLGSTALSELWNRTETKREVVTVDEFFNQYRKELSMYKDPTTRKNLFGRAGL